MNQKTCPKCGEHNPPEAVMCWACYTPLSAGTGAGAASGGVTGAAPGPTVAPVVADAGGKAGVQPWMFGALGAVALLGIVIGMRALMGAGDGGPPVIGTPPVAPPGNPRDPGRYPPVKPPSTAFGIDPRSPALMPVVDVQVPFNTYTAPNPRQPVGVMSIVPRQASTSPPQAAGIAKYARTLYINSNRWSRLQIYVFADTGAAQKFAEFQSTREGAELSDDDYNQLADLWPRTLVCYEYWSNGRERVRYPAANPASWWVPATP